MKKLLSIVLLIILFLPLGAEEMPKFPAATVYLVGEIKPKDLAIRIYNEAGEELTREDALLSFVFPNIEEWEVSQSIYFRYSSHLAKQKAGKLIFQIGDLSLDDVNSLRTSLELTSENLLTFVENGDTFHTTFPAGPQDDVPIGKLTVKLRKRAEDVFSAGTYAGSFMINYTEGS
ncbi:hypothetical protein [Sphaerochaeta sp.]|uniref:hypothetical protein n=1 Tax=Sphaerochaeta sp. TaxID=1972642 RepID=UPI00258FF031|nr:hypothetical protein [Sphaerochaeta sp.]MDD3424416.1 hypothetical protein [Sphaerochaeta sp.]